MDDKPIECPWCKEVSYKPVRVEELPDGQEFIYYECEECPCQGCFQCLSSFLHFLQRRFYCIAMNDYWQQLTSDEQREHEADLLKDEWDTWIAKEPPWWKLIEYREWLEERNGHD